MDFSCLQPGVLWTLQVYLASKQKRFPDPSCYPKWHQHSSHVLIRVSDPICVFLHFFGRNGPLEGAVAIMNWQWALWQVCLHPWNDKYPKRAAADVHAKFCDDDPIGQKILRVEIRKDTCCLDDTRTLNESEWHAKSEVSVILYDSHFRFNMLLWFTDKTKWKLQQDTMSTQEFCLVNIPDAVRTVSGKLPSAIANQLVKVTISASVTLRHRRGADGRRHFLKESIILLVGSQSIGGMLMELLHFFEFHIVESFLIR